VRVADEREEDDPEREVDGERVTDERDDDPDRVTEDRLDEPEDPDEPDDEVRGTITGRVEPELGWREVGEVEERVSPLTLPELPVVERVVLWRVAESPEIGDRRTRSLPAVATGLELPILDPDD